MFTYEVYEGTVSKEPEGPVRKRYKLGQELVQFIVNGLYAP